MIGIIVGVLLLLSSLLFLLIYCENKEYKEMAVLSIIYFILAIIAPWTYKNNYNHNVTIIAQNGQKYTYEECYIKISKDKVIIDFKDEPSIIFYSPIKVEENEDNVD